MSRSLHLPLTPPVSPSTLILVFPNNTTIIIIPSFFKFHCCWSCSFSPLFLYLYICNRSYMRLWLSSLCVLAGCTYFFCVGVHVCVFSVHCVDSKTSAVRSFGDTWLQWRGQRVEYCRCALKGQKRCHIVPVISECDIGCRHTQTHVD